MIRFSQPAHHEWFITQVRPSMLPTIPIIDAMLKVAREDYVPAARREAPIWGKHQLGEDVSC